ncbi:hypothetical protein CTI14_03755 [Methylobacterium radiotolerans]|nr:hypothetical protein CTI14_03755 [Methylobacterium radiotolerans]
MAGPPSAVETWTPALSVMLFAAGETVGALLADRDAVADPIGRPPPPFPAASGAVRPAAAASEAEAGEVERSGWIACSGLEAASRRIASAESGCCGKAEAAGAPASAAVATAGGWIPVDDAAPFRLVLTSVSLGFAGIMAF